MGSWVILAVGAVLLLYSLMKLYREKATSQWEKVRVSVVRSGVKKVGEVYRYHIHDFFVPVIRYEYVVSGIEYKSDWVAFDEKSVWFESKPDATGFVSKFEAQPVAYFNPKKLGDSVIVRNYPRSRLSHYYAIFLSGVMVVSFGLLLLLEATP